MVDETIIKPIPKYIINKIKKLDDKTPIDKPGRVRFYKYFAIWKKHLVEVTVAVKNKYKKWYCKQVVIHCDCGNICYVKDIKYTMIAGYSVGWYAEGLQKYEYWYESKNWDYANDRYFNINAIIVNPELALKLEKYKYSAVLQYNYIDKLKYLRFYEKYPQTEYLVKLGLTPYCLSKMLVKKLIKDKSFRKWLIKNKDELALNRYNIPSLFQAYKTNKPIKYTQSLLTFKRDLKRDEQNKKIVNLFNCIENLFNYLEKQKTDIQSYKDYLNACENLELNMSDSKNYMPHNFKHWHDVRINEFHSKLAKIDEEKRKELYNNFKTISNKYEKLQRQLKDGYITLIAHSPNDLINEGEILHHCVGKMGYDQKFAREESLIFFIRLKEQPEIPLATLEYDLKTHKILQCYGGHDSKPSDELMEYVTKIWLPYANRKIKQISI